MTGPDDIGGDMRGNPFDDNTADAVLSGTADPADVPAGLREVAELAQVARRPASGDELADEDVMVARIAAALGTPAELQPGDSQEGSLVHGRLRMVRMAAAAAALVLVGGTAAAAASGVLPQPVQQSLANAASNVGISLPHHAHLAASHTSASVHHLGAPGQHKSKVHHGLPVTPPPGAFGTVASVNGATAAGSCGQAGMAGTFTLAAHKDTTVTVNVDATATTFADAVVATPTFANVCVGALVGALGTNTNNVVTATKVVIAPPHDKDHKPGAFGKVASVGGLTADGSCGQADQAGSFTLTAFKATTVTVNVDTNTAFVDPGVTKPTFGNVCVGEIVAAVGTNTNNVVTATKVYIAPMHPKPKAPEGAFGKVVSVGGVSTDKTCGQSGQAGSFVLTSFKGAMVTVNVDSSTTFSKKGVAKATFGDVCVGEGVGAQGATANNVVTATKVFIAAPHPDGPDKGHHGPPPGAFGKVTSVGGVSTAGKCGSGTDGTFVVTEWKDKTVTVNVSAATKYMVPGVAAPSFANVCVGDVIAATGSVSGSTVTATKVFVAPAGHGPGPGDKHGFAPAPPSGNNASHQGFGFGGGGSHGFGRGSGPTGQTQKA